MTQTGTKLRRTTPLVSLDAIVLDTETTGLNPRADRIVEIGAIHINKGNTDFGNPFETLVNPGIPISPASTAIHHITDDKVASAGDFPEAFERFRSFCSAPLIIGFSIGFDLAVIKEECQRHDVNWSPPPCLDVQLLAQIAAPNLPDKSLDTLAAWLNIGIEERHSALGDAIATSKVFDALIPLLSEKGVFTYVEAQRICNRLTLPTDGTALWHDIRDESALRVRGVNEFARVDSFPYRHQVADLMNSPVTVAKPDQTLNQALDVMVSSGVSSVFANDHAGVRGILTEKDILRLIHTEGPKVMNAKVGKQVSKPLITIRKQDHLYKAIARMASQNIAHLAVVDAEDELVGALTARDLLKQRSLDARVLGDNIDQAETPADLATIWPELTRVTRNLYFEQLDARNIASIISMELRELTRRACEIAEREMIRDGKGPAPCPWAMLVLGSGGRGESLLAMDQDNAIIFQTGDPGGPEDTWFEQLGTRATHILHQVGVPLCKGNIMASNPEWRMSEARWRDHIGHWISRAKPQDIMNADIFFDATMVIGDQTMFEKLEADALEAASNSRNFLKLLSLNVRDIPDTIGWFGKIKTKNGRLDVKWNGLLPVISAARVLAIQHRISATSTPDRLGSAASHETDKADILENLKEAHRIFLGSVLRQQLEDGDIGIPVSNNVSLAALSSFEMEELKWALEQVRAIPDLLGIASFH